MGSSRNGRIQLLVVRGLARGGEIPTEILGEMENKHTLKKIKLYVLAKNVLSGRRQNYSLVEVSYN